MFTAYVSSDGVAWAKVISKTITMSTTATAGLFVCSHNAAQLGAATFDNVVLSKP